MVIRSPAVELLHDIQEVVDTEQTLKVRWVVLDVGAQQLRMRDLYWDVGVGPDGEVEHNVLVDGFQEFVFDAEKALHQLSYCVVEADVDEGWITLV